MPLYSKLRWTLASVVLIAACGGGDSGPTPPETQSVSSVSVTPQASSIAVSQTLQFTAALRDASNNALTGRTVNWSASPSSVGTVNATGLVAALTPGVLTVTATSEGKSGSAQVTVIAN